MLLMALYTYKSTHARTLAFLAGDKFIEIGASLDPNWLHVINECGIVGYVPKNYIGSFQGSASQCQDFIDGCIEGIHLRSCEGGGIGGRKDQETLQRLVQLRQTAATKRQAPPPPPQHPEPNSCPSSLSSPASGEVITSFSAQDTTDGAKSLTSPTPPAPLASPISSTAPPTPQSEVTPCNSTSSHQSVTTASKAAAANTSTCNSVSQGADGSSSSETTALLDVRAASRALPPGLLRSLVAEVRQTTQVSYTSSQQVVTLVLQSLASAVPALQPLTQAIMADSSVVLETGAKQQQWWQKSADASLAVQLLEKLRQCKDDEQQRSWALREDLPTITRHLQQLLDVLRNGEVSAVREVLRLDDYRPLLTLVQYYQMETRSALRRLLLQIFSTSCQLSAANASYLATSVLPVELAREMMSPDTPTEGLECCACPLVLLLASCEALPYTHYTILNGSFVSLLLAGIEQHSSEPHSEQLAHLYMICLLAFNLHDWPRHAATGPFSDASAGPGDPAFDTTQNILLQLLGAASSTTYFAEKLLLLFNREEDPLSSLLDSEVGMGRSHSVLQMVEDLYTYRATAELFYTNDERVLCDILLRQLTDLAPQDERRAAYVRISAGVLVHGRWLEHEHRLIELRDSFNAILRDAADTDENVVAVVREAVKSSPQLLQQ